MTTVQLINPFIASSAAATDPDLSLWLAPWKESGLSNGDRLATLTDFSTNTRHFTQATAGNKPRYDTGVLNSQPGFFFDGSAYFAECSAFMSSDAELFAVLKATNNTEAQGAYKFDGCTSACHISFFGTIYTAFGGTGRFSYTPSPSSNLTGGFIHQVVAKAGTNNWKVYENGNVNKVTTTNTQGWGTSRHLVGASSDQTNASTTTNFFHGHVLEFRIYGSPRSDAQRNVILADFNSRFGISVTNF